MRPDYGCALATLIFSSNDDTTAGLAIHYVRRAVERFEPRAVVISVDAGPAPQRPDVLDVVLEYRPRAGGRQDPQLPHLGRAGADVVRHATEDTVRLKLGVAPVTAGRGGAVGTARRGPDLRALRSAPEARGWQAAAVVLPVAAALVDPRTALAGRPLGERGELVVELRRAGWTRSTPVLLPPAVLAGVGDPSPTADGQRLRVERDAQGGLVLVRGPAAGAAATPA